MDDILLFSPDKGAILKMKNHLTEKYKMTDLGEIRQYLGIQIERNRSLRTLRIHQKPYLESILQSFQMENCTPVSTPMEPNIQLLPTNYIATKDELSDYQKGIGKIMYAMLGTRPDLAFTVSILSRFMSQPGPEHALALRRALRYIRKTLDIGIIYGGLKNDAVNQVLQESNRSLNGLYGFTDLDWAGDKETRKSTSGFLFTFYGGAISWKSSKQPIIATSTTEAEYIACTEAAKEAIWLRRIMHEIRGETCPKLPINSHDHETHILIENMINQSFTTNSVDDMDVDDSNAQVIFGDNQGSIKLSKNPQHHNRTKHIDVKYHFIRDNVQQGLIKLLYIPTNEMVADILTKSLPRDKHEKHMQGMGMGTSIISPGNNMEAVGA